MSGNSYSTGMFGVLGGPWATLDLTQGSNASATNLEQPDAAAAAPTVVQGPPHDEYVAGSPAYLPPDAPIDPGVSQDLVKGMSSLRDFLIKTDAAFYYADSNLVRFSSLRRVDQMKIMIDLYNNREMKGVSYFNSNGVCSISVTSANGSQVRIPGTAQSQAIDQTEMASAALNLLRLLPRQAPTQDEVRRGTEPIYVQGIDIDVYDMSQTLKLSPETVRKILHGNDRYIMDAALHYLTSSDLPWRLALFVAADILDEGAKLPDSILPFLTGINGGKDVAITIEGTLSKFTRKEFRDAVRSLFIEITEDLRADVGRGPTGEFTDKYREIISQHLSYSLNPAFDASDEPIQSIELRFQPWEIWEQMKDVPDDRAAVRQQYLNFCKPPGIQRWMPIVVVSSAADNERLVKGLASLRDSLLQKDAAFWTLKGRESVPFSEMRNIDQLRIMLELYWNLEMKGVRYNKGAAASSVSVPSSTGGDVEVIVPDMAQGAAISHEQLKTAGLELLRSLPLPKAAPAIVRAGYEPLVVDGIDVEIGFVSMQLHVSPETVRTLLEQNLDFVRGFASTHLDLDHPCYYTYFAAYVAMYLSQDSTADDKRIEDRYLPVLSGSTGGLDFALSVERQLSQLKRKEYRDAVRSLYEQLVHDPRSNIGRRPDGTFTDKYQELLDIHVGTVLPTTQDAGNGPLQYEKILYAPWETWEQMTDVPDDRNAVKRAYVNFTTIPGLDALGWQPFFYISDKNITAELMAINEANRDPARQKRLLGRASADVKYLFARMNKLLDEQKAAASAN